MVYINMVVQISENSLSNDNGLAFFGKLQKRVCFRVTFGCFQNTLHRYTNISAIFTLNFLYNHFDFILFLV